MNHAAAGVGSGPNREGSMGTDRPRIPATATPPSLPAMRIAAALAAFTGLGFGIPCALGIWHFARTGEVWTFLGKR